MMGPDRSRGQADAIDLQELVDDLSAQAEKTGELAERLGAESEELAGAGEKLIDDMAEHLATLREAAGLPSKEPDQLKARIKKRQRTQ
jgi:hypothetical protein